jgi:hypothetical protein
MFGRKKTHRDSGFSTFHESSFLNMAPRLPQDIDDLIGNRTKMSRPSTILYLHFLPWA